MDIPLDEVVYFDAISSSSTGAAADADSTPTFAVYEESTDTDIGVGGNMTKRTSLTGNYRGSFTASAANGFEVGKWYSVIGSATIGGVATKGVLKSFRIILAEAVAGAPKTDLTYILGTLLTETAGQIAAGFKKWFNVSAPTGTVNSLPDAVPGAASGLAIVGSAMTLASSAVQAIWDAATSGLTTVGSIGKAILDNWSTLLVTRFTSARAGYLDNLSGGAVAQEASLANIQNNTRTVIVVPEIVERPDSGTVTYLIHLYLYDEVGNMEAPDAAPTVALANASGSDLSSRLDSATGTLVGTGHYKWVYTSSSVDALEQLLWEFSVGEGGATRLFGRGTLIVDTTAADFTSSDRTKLDAVYNKLPINNIADQTLIDTDLSNIETDTQDIQSRLPAALTGDGNIKADSLKLNGSAPNNVSVAGVWNGDPGATPPAAGSYGDKLNRLSQQVAVTGTVQASPTPTTTTFRVSSSYDLPTGANDDALITFTSGGLYTQTRPILSITRISSSVHDIVVSEAFTSAPSTGDACTIICTAHVHPVPDIAAGVRTELTTELARIDATISSRGTADPGDAMSVSDKTGFKLASDGLDTVSTTEPAGVASNFREMVVQTWRRFFKKTTMTSTETKTYKDNGTVATTQVNSDDGTTQTIDTAS